MLLPLADRRGLHLTSVIGTFFVKLGAGKNIMGRSTRA
jgi:hypothetical protein